MNENEQELRQLFTTTQQSLPLPAPMIRRLQQTAQNPKYHAEGSVYNHTLMVLQQFHKYIDSYQVSEADREVLYWAAILHDLGKTVVTRWINNRWSSKNHERAGVPIARDILLARPEISPEQRQRILSLVRWHHVPLRWGLNDTPINTYKLLSTRVDLKLLGIFSTFDILGRVCVKKAEVLALVLNFLEVIVPTIEKQMGSFSSIQTRFESAGLRKKNALWTTFQQREAPLLEKVLDMKVDSEPGPHGTCILTVGAPRAGKTAYVQNHYPDHIHIDVEKLNTTSTSESNWKELTYVLKTHLRQNHRLVLDGTNLDSCVRHRIANMIKEQNAALQFLFFERSMQALLNRNSSHIYPQQKSWLQKAHNSVYHPHPWESHSIELV